MKIALLALGILTFSATSYAIDMTSYGRQCQGTETSELKDCLFQESGKIDEANLPNEIILTTKEAGRKSLEKLVLEFTKDRTDPYAQKLVALLPTIQSSVATALIIQYEDEPQLYYYVVDKNGKLEVVFDGLNSVDISSNFPEIFNNEPDTFSLKSPNVSDSFKEWLTLLKEE